LLTRSGWRHDCGQPPTKNISRPPVIRVARGPAGVRRHRVTEPPPRGLAIPALLVPVPPPRATGNGMTVSADSTGRTDRHPARSRQRSRPGPWSCLYASACRGVVPLSPPIRRRTPFHDWPGSASAGPPRSSALHAQPSLSRKRHPVTWVASLRASTTRIRAQHGHLARQPPDCHDRRREADPPRGKAGQTSAGQDTEATLETMNREMAERGTSLPRRLR
jgi:hypothetical protein